MAFINVDKNKEKIAKTLIDTEDFLGLKGDRTRLVPYGVALGLDDPKALSSKVSLMREDQVSGNNELCTMLTCAKIYHLKEDDDLNEELAKLDKILDNADLCLNSGLDEIENIIYNYSENRTKRLIEDLNEKYEELVKK